MIGDLEIVATSDLHGFLPEISKPADIAIVAGDIIPVDIQFNIPASFEWYKNKFAPWISAIPVNHVFMVGGNHDAYLERLPENKKSLFLDLFNGKLTYLRNSLAEYFDSNGLKWTIFGTPYCREYGNWPFMRSDKTLREKFKKIPDKVDIIISHDPPFAVGDCDVILETSRRPDLTFQHLGNHPLAERVNNVNYKLLVCGHIHGGDHELNPWFKIVNVSYLNEGYVPINPPFYTKITHDW